MFDALSQDIRYAAASLTRHRLLTAVVVLSLALGIGANTAIFSVFERLLLRRLPVPAPEEIVNLTLTGPRPGWNSTTRSGGTDAIFSYSLFRNVERLEQAVFTGIAAHRDFPANLSYENDTAAGDGLLVSGGYFPVLGIAPALGRLLTPEDDRVRNGHPVVVLSHSYWSTRFGQSPTVLGDTLVVNAHPLTIIGVAPDGFAGTTTWESPHVFVPLAMAETMRPGWDRIDLRNDHWLYLFARLRGGVSRERAEALVNVPFLAITRDVEFPILRNGMGESARRQFLIRRIVLQDGAHGRNVSRDDERQALLLFMVITGLVLLIACANVANLLLARAADRASEIEIRLSLGAAPGRIVRLLLTEACMLGLLGGLSALLVARWAMAGLLSMVPPDDWPPFGLGLNAAAFAYALALGLATGVLFGLFPAVQAVRAGVSTGLHARTTRVSTSRTRTRFRTTLATAQIALATALLALGGLFVLSLVNLSRVDPGIRPDGLVSFSVLPSLNGSTPAQSMALFERLEDSLHGMPGVTAVTATTVPLLSGSNQEQNVTVEGFRPGPDTDTHSRWAAVGTDYFRTLGIPLLVGREFTVTDAQTAPKVAVVNEAFATKFGLGDDPVGIRMALGEGDNTQLDIEIVGLVRDAKYDRLRSAPPPQFFLPYRQTDTSRTDTTVLTFYARSNSDVRPLLTGIRSAVGRLDSTLPVVRLGTMADQIWAHTTGDRLQAVLASVFAAFATILAGIGLYAVLAYAVAQRWREIGVRVALGATPGNIRRLIIGDVGRITVVGCLIGTGVALGLGRVGESFLFGLDGSDGRVLLAAAVIVLCVASAAAALPARRAASVNPVEALRAE